ncbi:hypothetical protein PRZ48_013869 [Zasmidium cellare]|uniref:SnoaL-like domain-containing protein n=1 Tax=Zasmidium cellare TaxID=395010 RepID=A0ABR0E282_ZASCE|nr:hypothetical protein PRZ48_013869 [Zasmidium cellare]
MDILFPDKKSHTSAPSSRTDSPSSTFDKNISSWLSSTSSSDTSSLTSPSADSQTNPTTADTLISLLMDYVSAANNRTWDDFTGLEQYFHPSFTTECRFTSKLQSFPEGIKTLQDLVEISPAFHIKLHEASAKVDEPTKTAFVFIHSDWVGAPPGNTTQSMQVFEWRFVDGMWLCYRSNVMRGIDEVV